MRIEFGGTYIKHITRSLTKRYHPRTRSVRTHKVGGTQFSIAMTNTFIDGARDLATFDVRRWDVLHGTDNGDGQGFNTVTMDHYQIGPMFLHKI